MVAAVLVVFLVGIWAAEQWARTLGRSDPGQIVIDEVAGQWLVLAGAPLTWRSYLAGLLLFRFFDILKPWPIRWADRSLHGGVGIMADDILAGLLGLAIMWGWRWWQG